MTSCREIRQALGVYVLGAIDPAERAQVDAHLAECPDCREELASLAGLPALLRKVPMAEAERLAATDPEADPEVPSEAMLHSLMSHTARVRRIHRWRGLAAAAAVAVLAAGGGVAVANALQPSSSVVQLAWQRSVGVNAATGVRLTVMYRPTRSGTEMKASISGLKPGTECQFQVTDNGGTPWSAGGWRQDSWKGNTEYPASIWLNEKTIRSFDVTVNGKVVASAHA